MRKNILPKTTHGLLAATSAIAMACSTLCGQDSTSTPAAKPLAASPAGPLSITTEQQEKFKAAYQTAVKDPKVLAAVQDAKGVWDSYRALVKKKILASDPSMQPLFDKAENAAKGPLSPDAAGALTPDDKQLLQAAFLKVSQDPDIKAGMAKTVDAMKSKDVVIRAAILQADPSLAPVLDEIDKVKAQQAAASAAAAAAAASAASAPASAPAGK